MPRLVAIVAWLCAATAHASPQAMPGWAHYEQLCAACHGTDGDGRGAAAPFTRGDPRDFTQGAFEWRSTPFGAPPTDEDLRRTVRLGARGTSMPGFAGVLSDPEIDELVAIVRAFGPRARSKPPIALGAAPAATDAARGATLWSTYGCASCHGPAGHGDGPATKAMREPPYDLTAEPLRRPRASDAPADRRRAAAWSIATGMTGTPMPGYAQIPNADLWALADRVVELNASATDDRMRMGRAKLVTGTWPGANADEASTFGAPVPLQGAPPASLAPAEASLSAQQCGRCHAKQFREWQPSLHAGAASSGLAARFADGVDPTSCRRCHAPLAEQATDAQLFAQGVSCAGCHVRGWTRRGPPNVAPSLLARPGYPFRPSALYERADFCLPCHQLPPSTAVAGKPLLNTYKEWLEGPYPRRGIECESCHMANREHQWLGVHDPATFRQGIRLTATAHRDGDAIAVTAELANVGAGHDLPTTPTPAVWLRVELLDRAAPPSGGAAGRAQVPAGEGTRVVATFEQRIGRDVYYDGTWHERADTRIPPGESLRVARTWRGVHATLARVTVEVHPDAYYEGFYASRLAASPLYQAALDRARGSHYIAETREIAIP